MYRTLAESIVSTPSPVRLASHDLVEASALKFFNSQLSKQQHQDVKQELLRSQSDKFDYKLIQLKNGIRILLISDPSYKELASGSNASSQENVHAMETSDAEFSDSEGSDSESVSSSSSTSSLVKKGNDKLAAFVVAVNIGSFKDPNEFQGMAHMLEHMMSMGSEEFPSENAFDDFLSSRGGYQNAHTECEYTMYEVKVQRRYLKQAIDMLGKAFVAPLLREESIEREIKPIDTEFVEACTSDEVRAQLLLSHLANSQHPLNKFSWGNRKSLITDPSEKGLNIRQSLVDFFNAYYRPENIVVVVQSQEPLDNLEQWTANVFSDVKVRSASAPGTPVEAVKSTVTAFDITTKFNRFYVMESINSGTRLNVHWCLPPVLDKYLSSPFDYLCSLIGHEGKGSLIAELRKRDLAIDLVTDSDYFCFKNNSHLSIFSIDLYLTNDGARRLDEVIALLFEYISVIRKVGAQEYFFRENQAISLKSFNNKSEKSPLTYAIDMAKNLMNYPVEHSLIGHKLYYHYDKSAIDELLAHFLPHNANFIHIGGKFKPELTILQEPWMLTKYQVMPVSPTWIERANQCTGVSEYFHYPKPNPFIASKFDLLRDTLSENAPERLPTEYPTKIQDTDRFTVWYKADLKFNLPKASIHLHILSPCLDDTLRNVALADVLFEYLMITLKEDAYDALAAELSWELTPTYNGIYVRAFGFNHKLAELIMLILGRFKTVEFNPIILKSMKNEVTKHYNNDYQEPENFNQHLRLSALMERFYTFLDRWTQIESIDLEQLSQYRNQLLSNLSVELLVQGNMTIAETLDLGKRIDNLFGLSKGQTGLPYPRIKNRVAQLPVGVRKIRALTLTHKNPISHVVCYYQLKPYDFESQCYLSLFIEMVNELCFNTLRTKEGLGYSVGCCENDTFGVLGFNVYVFSNADKFKCSFIEGRISEFVDKTCFEYVQKLSKAKFDEFASSAIRRKQAPDVSLEHEVRRNMDEITCFDYCFDRLKREIAVLKQATLEGLQKWTSEYLFVPASQRKQLTIQVVGNGVNSLEECLASDLSAVTESMIPTESSHSRCKPLQLLQSKDDQERKNFILNLEAFKKQLELYPSQAPAKDLKS